MPDPNYLLTSRSIAPIAESHGGSTRMQVSSAGRGAEQGIRVLSQPIRIVLVEDHVILREGLKALIDLEPDMQVVGDYGGAEECIEGIGSLQPDLFLTDFALPLRSKIDLLSALKRLFPEARRAVLTAEGGEECIRAALGNGALGYMLKDVSSLELMEAIRTVASGRQFLCRATVNNLLRGYLSGDARAAPQTAARALSEREREVLIRIAYGNTNKFIARELGLSLKTVEKHRSNLMRKLQLRNAATLTMYAMRNGLLDASVERAARADRIAVPC